MNKHDAGQDTAYSEAKVDWWGVLKEGQVLLVTPWKHKAKSLWDDLVRQGEDGGAGLIHYHVKSGEVASAMPWCR